MAQAPAGKFFQTNKRGARGRAPLSPPPPPPPPPPPAESPARLPLLAPRPLARPLARVRSLRASPPAGLSICGRWDEG